VVSVLACGAVVGFAWAGMPGVAAADDGPRFEHWLFNGTLSDARLGETIALPCEFNGQTEVPGPLEGNSKCTPTTASGKLFGLVPVKLGLTETESAPITATLSAVPGLITFTGTYKANLGVTSVALLGLTIPTSCATAEPLVFALEVTRPTSEIVTTGFPFSGTVNVPRFKCSGGLLGPLFGVVASGLLSGPDNAFTITLAPGP